MIGLTLLVEMRIISCDKEVLVPDYRGYWIFYAQSKDGDVNEI